MCADSHQTLHLLAYVHRDFNCMDYHTGALLTKRLTTAKLQSSETVQFFWNTTNNKPKNGRTTTDLI